MRDTNSVGWQDHEILIVDDDESQRRDKPFVPVNYGVKPAEPLESELFGKKKGYLPGPSLRGPVALQ